MTDKPSKHVETIGDREINFSDTPVVFGRSPEADVVISDPSVSLRHCAIRLWDDDLIIKDLSSTNGVKVNGVKINRVALLKRGDSVQIGNVIFEV